MVAASLSKHAPQSIYGIKWAAISLSPPFYPPPLTLVTLHPPPTAHTLLGKMFPPPLALESQLNAIWAFALSGGRAAMAEESTGSYREYCTHM